MTDKISEIKFISDNHDMLISKIDLTNNKLNTIINEISNDLKDCILQFTNTINNKLKVIESKFNKQTEELTILKKELENKSFDDKNYMNVSITMNLSKQIKERDLKIKELEQRIKFIENKKQTEIIPEIVPEVVPEVVSEVVPEVVSEMIPEVVQEVIPEVIKSKTKKTSVKIKQTETILDSEPSPDKITKKIKKSKNEEVKAIVEEVKPIVEEVKPIIEEIKPIIEEIKPIEEINTMVEEVKTIEEINPIVEEIKPIEEKKSKKKNSNKVKKEKIVKQDNIEISLDNKEDVIEVKYPETIADISDIDILEVNNKNYFIDKQNNIYQITDDQDIGIFLGVYDKTDNKIIYMK
jgi:hypothetical protein